MQDVAARHADRKRDSEQMAGGSTDDQPAATAAAATATSSTSEAADKTQAGIAAKQQHRAEICSQWKDEGESTHALHNASEAHKGKKCELIVH